MNYTLQKLAKAFSIIALTGVSGIMDAQMNWSPAGPIYNAGRARNMIVDKTNPNILYVGSASSGIFVSNDAGANWAPIDDQGRIRNISYLAQSQNGTIYAGTGEGFLRPGQKAKAEVGTGLYKLGTTGSTQTLVLVAPAAMTGTVINRVACDPGNANRIALATNLGILVSTDGTNFNPVSLPGVSTGTTVSGQDVKFDSNGILYCSIGSEAGTSTLTPSKVYKSDAGLNTFTAITPTSSVLQDANYGRIELAIAPSNNNVIYASCSNKFTSESSATLKGLFVSYDAGANWALMLQGSSQLDPLSDGGQRASGDYAHVLTVDPISPNVLIYGGYSTYLWMKSNTSTTNPIGNWYKISQNFFANNQTYLHENVHDIKIVPGNPVKVYFITDAGIYRSIDLTSANVTGIASYQPFYKGLVTGQFNSVSIERFPTASGVTSTVSGSQITPYSGFIGGTGGNGLTYFSGTHSLVTQEISYLGGEIYNAEYSKMLSDAALMSTGNGRLFRSTNVKTSPPVLVNVNNYTGVLSKIAPDPVPFVNNGVTTGTPFKLWENFGLMKNTPDSAVFYNDTIRYQTSMSGVATLTSQSTFTFSANRPNQYALIDSIVVRTATVQLPMDGTYKDLPTPFNAPGDKLTIRIKLDNNYAVTGSLTALSTTNAAGPILGPATVTLNQVSLIDNISVTFTAPPFAAKTASQYPAGATGTAVIVPDPAVYYRVYATVFYKYKANDIVHVVDNNISTRTSSYSAVLTKPLNWAYGGSSASYTITANQNNGIPNPTFVLTPGGNTSPTPTFVVNPSLPVGVTSYTISQFGTYTLNARPVTYTISAVTDTSIPSPTYNLMPGNVTQTNTSFVVTPTTTTDYTITQTGAGPGTAFTFSTVNSSTYALNSASASVTQTSPVFIVTPTVATTYTLLGLSSDVSIGANTTTTSATNVARTTVTVGVTVAPVAPNNQPIKIPSLYSARLAMILNNANTGNQPAVVVSKNPLALNDPLNFVRISQSGCWRDDANGLPTFSTITIPGRPILLEWSKSGTELYYATNDNKVYRVSHITEIMDLSPSSYSGKFYTDIFKYASPPNNSALNPDSPYRTTLIGQFDRPITSISVSNDDKNVAVTFNGAVTGTTGVVMYNTNDARTSDVTNIGWANKEGAIANITTYCSMMEKNDSKKVFVGTDVGIFYTSDIATGIWNNVNTMADANSKLPNVQIFDIKQQTLNSWDCYNSGQIYVATNGRGIWTNKTFFAPFLVGVEDYQEKAAAEKNLKLYPNPTNGNVFVAFNAVDGETATVQIMDVSGRILQTQELGKQNPGDAVYTIETSSLNSGIYIVNVESNSGIKRVEKLIVTK